MKKVNLSLAVMFLFLLSTDLNAQTITGTDYFASEWHAVAESVPG